MWSGHGCLASTTPAKVLLTWGTDEGLPQDPHLQHEYIQCAIPVIGSASPCCGWIIPAGIHVMKDEATQDLVQCAMLQTCETCMENLGPEHSANVTAYIPDNATFLAFAFKPSHHHAICTPPLPDMNAAASHEKLSPQGAVHTGCSNSESHSTIASPNSLAGWMI